MLTEYSEADDELMGRRVTEYLPRIEFGSIDECAGIVHRQHVAVLRFVRAYFGNEQFFNFQFLTTHGSDKARKSDNWFEHLRPIREREKEQKYFCVNFGSAAVSGKTVSRFEFNGFLLVSLPRRLFVIWNLANRPILLTSHRTVSFGLFATVRFPSLIAADCTTQVSAETIGIRHLESWVPSIW